MTHNNNQITAVILTKNENKNIERALKSLQWCDQIQIIDDYSEDNTLKIARKYNAQIFKRKLNQNFAKQRNFAIKHVKTEWTLFVDADEEIPFPLAEEITMTIQKDYPLAYRIKRQDIFFGKKLKHGETSKWKNIRLAKTNAGKWINPVHELWKIKGTVGQLQNHIMHYSQNNMNDFLTDINNYSTIAAKNFYKQKKTTNKLQIIIYPITKFSQNYIFRMGILDGTHGFILAVCMSFHSFLVRGKLYLLWKNKK